jgi:DNA-binding NtrC family response regulator
MNGSSQILVASSDLESRRALTAILSKEGWETICASRANECQEILANQNITLVFCDRRLADGTYRDVLAASRSVKQRVRLVVTSRLADWDEYLEALHHGAFDLIASPCQPTDVLWTIIQARREEHERSVFLSPTKSPQTSSSGASF